MRKFVSLTEDGQKEKPSRKDSIHSIMYMRTPEGWGLKLSKESDAAAAPPPPKIPFSLSHQRTARFHAIKLRQKRRRHFGLLCVGGNVGEILEAVTSTVLHTASAALIKPYVSTLFYCPSSIAAL